MSEPAGKRPPMRLAKHLRDVRRNAGLSQIDMAERIGRTQSWVSLIEREQISLTHEVLEKWCDALNLSGEERQALANDFSREIDKYTTWRQVWADGVDRVQQERRDLEERSSHLRFFQSTFVHSLLQIPGYTEAIYYATRFFSDDSQLTRYLQARLARQSVLLAPNKQIDALLCENALRAMIASPEIMAAQMEHLAKLSERNVANIRILTFTEPVTVLAHSSWDVFDETVAIVEFLSGQVKFNEPGELALYVDTFELLWEDALQGDEVQDFLRSMAREYERFIVKTH